MLKYLFLIISTTCTCKAPCILVTRCDAIYFIFSKFVIIGSTKFSWFTFTQSQANVLVTTQQVGVVEVQCVTCKVYQSVKFENLPVLHHSKHRKTFLGRSLSFPLIKS